MSIHRLRLRPLKPSTRAARPAGFTLIELMVTVAVIAILASLALPAYFDYITRSRIVEATTKLSDLRTQMEKYFMDNRQYTDIGGSGKCGVDVLPIDAFANYNADPKRNFTVTCPPASATANTYILLADGVGSMAGFQYQVDQTNAKASKGPAGWNAAPNCWLLRRDGSCS